MSARLAALAAVLALLSPLAARAEVGVELVSGVALRPDPLGAYAPEWTLGLRAPVRLFALPLAIEPGWTMGSRADGTGAVEVRRTVHAFQLALRAELDLGLEAGGIRLLPYAAAGPALVHTGVGYAVRDPVGGGAQENGAGALRPGAVGGLGLGAVQPTWLPLPLRARLEAQALLRDDALDLLLHAGAGVAF